METVFSRPTSLPLGTRKSASLSVCRQYEPKIRYKSDTVLSYSIGGGKRKGGRDYSVTLAGTLACCPHEPRGASCSTIAFNFVPTHPLRPRGRSPPPLPSNSPLLFCVASMAQWKYHISSRRTTSIFFPVTKCPQLFPPRKFFIFSLQFTTNSKQDQKAD